MNYQELFSAGRHVIVALAKVKGREAVMRILLAHGATRAPRTGVPNWHSVPEDNKLACLDELRAALETPGYDPYNSTERKP